MGRAEWLITRIKFKPTGGSHNDRFVLGETGRERERGWNSIGWWRHLSKIRHE